MALTRAQYISGNVANGVVLPGQPQGVRPGGIGITIDPDGVINVNGDDPNLNSLVKTNNPTAQNNYIWPNFGDLEPINNSLLSSNPAGVIEWVDIYSVGIQNFISTTPPVANRPGDLWFNPDTEVEAVWDGSAWIFPGVTQTGPTGYAVIPVGNTGQRGTPRTGAFRYNTDTTNLEFYNGTIWTPPGFEPGTVMTFVQANPPLGWSTVNNGTFTNSTVRLTAGGGGGGSTGGTVGFNTFFNGSSTYSGSVNFTTGNTGNAVLSVNQLASHNHSVSGNVVREQGSAWSATQGNRPLATVSLPPTTFAGNNAAHQHSLAGASASGSFVSNFDVKYVNLLVARKD